MAEKTDVRETNAVQQPAGVRWVRFEATIPEPLANAFRELTPWKWRELRPFFCRYPENRRLRNLGSAIHTILEKVPHMLARGHWSVDEFIKARRELGRMIASVGHFVNEIARQSRLSLPVLSERDESVRPARSEKRRTG